ncbi:MAG: shikimate kinase [Odoribacter sp.]
MKYFLLGYMGSGKTRIGKEMAAEKGIRFFDLDAYIVEREHRTINAIFDTDGEERFRHYETRYLQEICELYENFVLSTGGGTPCYNGNMEYMNANGHTIFLDVDVDILTARLAHSKYKRPLIGAVGKDDLRGHILRHLAERMPFYSQAAEVMTIESKFKPFNPDR